MKKSIIAILCLLIVVAAWPSFAATSRGHRGMGDTGCDGMASQGCMPAGLNLTADQLTKLDDLRTAHLKDIKPLHDKIFSLRGDLRLLWLEKNPDPAKIGAVQKEIRTLRDQMEDKRTAHMLEVLKLLTPEQQIKFKTFMSRKGFNPGHDMGPGRGHVGHGKGSAGGNEPCM